MGECLGGCGGQRIEPELRVVGFACPGMLVFGTVAGEQEHTSGRQALDQAVQESLRLSVDPMEVLDDQAYGLDLASPQQ
jgi:hypothetical protein